MTLGTPHDFGPDIPGNQSAVEEPGCHSTTGTENDCNFFSLRNAVAELKDTGDWSPDHPKQQLLDNGVVLAAHRAAVADLKETGDWSPDHPSQRSLDSTPEYGRQYVVHRPGQIYPAYLVTYTNTDE